MGDDTLNSVTLTENLTDLLNTDYSLPTNRSQHTKRKSAEHKKRELKEWQRQHKEKVKQQYQRDLEKRHKPESHPFTPSTTTNANQIKQAREAKKQRRDEMMVEHQNKRIENAENLLHDMIKDEAELLEFESVMNLTQPVIVKKTASAKAKPKTTGNKRSPRKSASAIQRGRSAIHTSFSGRPAGYLPSGYRSKPPLREQNIPAQGYVQDCASALASSFDTNEQPMEDESCLLVPMFKGGKDDNARALQLLYSNEPLKRFGSEISLSKISDLISESDLSAESYLDWDVIDEMVAMLSNRELSTPSTGT